MSNVGASGGDSATLIQTIRTALIQECDEYYESAAAALAVLELRESERSKSLDASRVGGAEAGDGSISLDLETIAGALEDANLTICGEWGEWDEWYAASEALARVLASTTRGSASLPNPDPVESDRQSRQVVCPNEDCSTDVLAAGAWCPDCGTGTAYRGLGSASALEVEADELLGDLIGVAYKLASDKNKASDEVFQAVAAIRHRYKALASATKPEASPSPENLFTDRCMKSVEVARDTYGMCSLKLNHEGGCMPPERPFQTTTSTTSAERSPSPGSSRPVSTDEEEGQGLEDGGLQSRPSGGASR